MHSLGISNKDDKLLDGSGWQVGTTPSPGRANYPPECHIGRLIRDQIKQQSRNPGQVPDRNETAWLMLTFQSRCVICCVEPCSLGGTRGCAAVRDAVR